LLDDPGYDVAALVEKSGKSASHIYARMSLSQLIPTIAQAFTEERITASHANLIARLPQESQSAAYEQCWRKDWQEKEPHLLPAKHVAAWIQNNLYLSLADAPFDREDSTLNPAAGACIICPKRSGHNTTLCCDVQGDQCLDSSCYSSKVEAFLDREIAAHPGLIQIEESQGTATGTRTARPRSGLSNGDREPRGRTRHAMRRRQNSNRRLRQAAWTKANRLHRQTLSPSRTHCALLLRASTRKH
jgi:ParB family chromosome partitioning protein